MRGTAFVVSEVLLWMVLALLIGVVIGWLVRGWRREEKLRVQLQTEAEGDAGGSGEGQVTVASRSDAGDEPEDDESS
jgi:hypothetical protein